MENKMVNDVFDFVAMHGIETVRNLLSDGFTEMVDYKSDKAFGYGELTEIVRCYDFVKEQGYGNLVDSIEKNKGGSDFLEFQLSRQTHNINVVQALLLSADKLGLLHRFKHDFV